MGARSGAHGQYWDELNETLREIGYRCLQITCSATAYGVPQLRNRHVLIAWLGPRLIRFLKPRVPATSLLQALSNMEALPDHDPRHLTPGSTAWLISRSIKPGQKLSNVRGGTRSVHTWEIPAVFGPTTAGERALLMSVMRLRRRERKRTNGDADPVEVGALRDLFADATDRLVESLVRKKYLRSLEAGVDLAHTFNGKYRRLCPQAPSPTVDTRFGDPQCFLHPSDNRGFTVREAARIQGFPDDFTFSGSTRSKFLQIGNAVPPPLSFGIAQFVREALFS
jgi:DNA (cytosine-5)-methyltransferase 1